MNIDVVRRQRPVSLNQVVDRLLMTLSVIAAHQIENDACQERLEVYG
jgi:hypothetical protein